MEQTENLLNIDVSSSSLLKYALPTMLSNIVMNIYSIADQLFVSNLLGTDSLSAVSITWPFLAIALAIGTMIAMNIILMKIDGADGVAAAAIVLSAQTILSAAYAGYVQGIAPVISYRYGSGDYTGLNGIYKSSLRTVLVISVITFAVTFPLAKPIALMFASSSESVTSLAVRGTFILAPSLMAMGFNLLASGFFTALNDGKTSAILSLFRTLIFLSLCLSCHWSLIQTAYGYQYLWRRLPALLWRLYISKRKSQYITMRDNRKGNGIWIKFRTSS